MLKQIAIIHKIQILHTQWQCSSWISPYKHITNLRLYIHTGNVQATYLLLLLFLLNPWIRGSMTNEVNYKQSDNTTYTYKRIT